MAARKIKAKAQTIAAHTLEVAEDDLEWDVDGFTVKGLPEKRMTMKEIALAAYCPNLPDGMTDVLPLPYTDGVDLSRLPDGM